MSTVQQFRVAGFPLRCLKAGEPIGDNQLRFRGEIDANRDGEDVDERVRQPDVDFV